jgi:thiamine-phosphate pyrophosphorylase
MHQTSPGVERAVEAAKEWADKLGAAEVRLVDLLLGLLDEDEGRAAVLLERLGLSIPAVRQSLIALPLAPALPVSAVYTAARNWSLAFRADPAFLTDAFLLAVIRADERFRKSVTPFGLEPDKLEAILMHGVERPTEPEPSSATFILPGATGDIDTGRILDANFNRAREALRVLEEYCRFVLDDKFLTEQTKGLRHALAAAEGRLPRELLLAARETLRDVGTSVSASGEYDRATAADVAAANLKRLQESLRTLEEYGKLFGPGLGRELEAIRYQSYTLERALVLGSAARQRLADARLYVLISAAGCAASLDWTIRQAAAGGATMFQLREKSLPDRELIERARNVRRWTREVNALFVVNDRPDVAKLADADGVHLGQDDLPVREARRVLGPQSLIGVSTHTVEQVRQAVLDGADYFGVGPTFPSRTKPFESFSGLEFVRAATAETSLPAFALGGIGPENVAEVVRAGGRRVAASEAVCKADDPEQAARLLRAALDG